MGLQTLVSRVAGPLFVVLPSWFDDIRNLFIGDFVGRDNSGAPVAGCNLGTLAYPWGTAYVQNLLVNGSSIDTSQLESSPYKLVSGRVRTTSNQPDFIRASGAGTNFTVLATSTPLVLSIAGVAATWTADKAVAGTVAPAANNTATVNDSTAAGQAATRTWGEYGSGSPYYYAITMSAAGSAITAKVGTWQAFKIGTEYFVAYVESTTSLTRCFRGFFLDSSGNPVKRAAFSNGATITLMSLGWVFLDADGATVDTTYNYPTYAASAPSSPASGDYWFDQVNQVWKRYNGSSFVQVSRILAGLVVLDSTNCVASRSFDFFALDRSDNTIESDRVSNTVVKGSGLFQRVTVRRKRLAFITSRATWDTAANLASSSERYNAAVTASSDEYFYVSDTGETKISDVEPHFRADLLGWYHPHNTWRAIGKVTPDGSANFDTRAIYNYGSSVAGTDALDYAQSTGTTSTSISWAGSGSFTAVTGLSVAFTSKKGRPVRLELAPFSVTTTAGGNVVGANPCSIALYRDGAFLDLLQLGTNASAATLLNYFPASAVAFVDYSPGTSTRTYEIRANSGQSGEQIIFNRVRLVARQL
jgi:hypothetical protein